MVNMAESSKAFKMYHYQQIKCETKTEVGQYMRIRGRYGSEKGENDEKQTDPYPWLADDDPRRYLSGEEIMYEKIDLILL